MVTNLSPVPQTPTLKKASQANQQLAPTKQPEAQGDSVSFTGSGSLASAAKEAASNAPKMAQSLPQKIMSFVQSAGKLAGKAFEAVKDLVKTVVDFVGKIFKNPPANVANEAVSVAKTV